MHFNKCILKFIYMATACALTQDYNFDCEIGVGGVKTFYFIELPNVNSITESSGTVTAITKAGGKIFRKYDLVIETSNTDEAISGNKQNGTLFYGQTAVMIINRQQVKVRNEILIMAKTRLVLVAQDNNNDYRLYGRENGLQLATGNVPSGTAWADRNGYTLNFTGNERELAPFVDPSVIATLQT
jgi:hypothetical protein